MLPTPATPSGGTGLPPLSAKALVPAVRRRWRTATAVGLALGAAAAAGAWHLYPPLYTASALVLAAPPDPVPLGANFGQRLDREDIDGFQRTQVALARKPAVVKEALQRPDVRDTQTVRTAPDPVGRVLRAVQVGYVDGGDHLRFTLSDVRPDDLAPVLNAVKEAYLREARDGRKKHLEARATEVGELVGKSEDRLLKLRDELRKLAGPPASPAEAARYDALVRDHVRAESDLERARGAVALHKRRVQEAAKYTPAETDLDDFAAQDPRVAERQARVDVLEAALQNRTPLAADQNDGKAVEKKAELAAAQKARDEAAAAARERATAYLRKKMKEATAHDLADAELALELRTGEEADRRKKAEAEAPPPARGGAAVDQKRMEIAQAEDALRGLRAAQERLMVEVLVAPRNWSDVVGGDAETPAAPDRAAHVRRILLAGAGAFLIGLLLVGGWELLTHRLTTREDVSRAVGLRVVGDLPHLDRAGWFGPSAGASAAGFATALNTLRAVLLVGGKDAARVILITSAEPGEGKTTLAYNLARAIARAGVRTLLVDGDLLRPRLHESFGVPVGPGLGEVVGGDLPLGPLGVATHRTDVPGLCFLPAGAGGPAASDALHGGRAERLFREFRAGWDLVVIDGPPVLAAAEPLLLGRHADAALVAVRSGVSTAPQVRAACQRLADARVPVLGAVLTGTPSRSSGYYGYAAPRPPAETVALVAAPSEAAR